MVTSSLDARTLFCVLDTMLEYTVITCGVRLYWNVLARIACRSYWHVPGYVFLFPRTIETRAQARAMSEYSFRYHFLLDWSTQISFIEYMLSEACLEAGRRGNT